MAACACCGSQVSPCIQQAWLEAPAVKLLAKMLPSVCNEPVRLEAMPRCKPSMPELTLLPFKGAHGGAGALQTCVLTCIDTPPAAVQHGGHGSMQAGSSGATTDLLPHTDQQHWRPLASHPQELEDGQVLPAGACRAAFLSQH